MKSRLRAASRNLIFGVIMSIAALWAIDTNHIATVTMMAIIAFIMAINDLILWWTE
jgi:hypothetical protein